jgi:hypothetical protein
MLKVVNHRLSWRFEKVAFSVVPPFITFSKPHNRAILHILKKATVMEYSRIIGVTGLPGLYELVSSKSDGALVRSLEDGSTKFVSSRIHNLSHLESIEIYTTGENVNLVDVLNAMKASGTPLPDGKDNKALKTYFETVYPEMDFERVYASDMKKMVKWFEILEKSGVEYKLRNADQSETAEVAEEETVTAEAPAEEASAEKPKRTRKKKEAEE